MRAVEPHSEADPAAVLCSLLVAFGNAIGRGPHFLAGDAEHATNLYVCVVGETSSGRKGTSMETVRRLIGEADASWKSCVVGGLVSGEGVIRNRRTTMEKKDNKLVEKVLDPGVDDKRLLALVPEFAQMLGVIARKDNTLSAVLRDLWDRGDAQTTAKNSPERTKGALISVVAHITPAELRARLDATGSPMALRIGSCSSRLDDPSFSRAVATSRRTS